MDASGGKTSTLNLISELRKLGVTTTIYGLLDPRTLELRYIGKTRQVKTRFTRHCRPAEGDNTHRARWVRSLKGDGLLPTLEVFDEVQGDGCEEEIAAIGIARSLGCRLVNTTPGGDGLLGIPRTPEWCERISRALKGRVVSAETSAKLSAIAKARPASTFKGRKHSDATKAKMRANKMPSFRGRTHSAESRAKMSATKRAKKEALND